MYTATPSMLVPKSSQESLQVIIDAQKSLLSRYLVNMNQSNDIASRLMSESFDPEQMQQLTEVIMRHVDANKLERAVQLESVLQSTHIAISHLIKILHTGDLQSITNEIHTIAKGLAIALGASITMQATNPKDEKPI